MPVFAQPFAPAFAQPFALAFALSFTLTGAGFLIEGVPFAVAYLPFGIALVFVPNHARPRRLAFGLMAGHFIWPALISGWGLIQLGVNPFLVAAGGLCVTALISAGISWLGIGLSVLLLSAIPIFPASPLLVTGALLPGTGLWGLAALPLCLIVIEAQNRMALRAGLLAGLLALPPLVEKVFDPPAPVATAAYDEIDISHTVALTERGHWQQILSSTAPGDHLVLGENIFDHDDRAALSWWCRNLIARQASAMIGVRGTGGTGGTGEVWRIDATTCPQPRPVYRAEIGIPYITGGWRPGTWPQTSHFAPLAAHPEAPPEPAWLICFEAFSLWRWIKVALARPDQVIVLANDRWTAPIPTAVLRRKVTRQLGRLLGIEIFHADSGAVFLKARSASQPNLKGDPAYADPFGSELLCPLRSGRCTALD